LHGGKGIETGCGFVEAVEVINNGMSIGSTMDGQIDITVPPT
jgi:hypothetical protein